jgi:hypothetical protein
MHLSQEIKNFRPRILRAMQTIVITSEIQLANKSTALDPWAMAGSAEPASAMTNMIIVTMVEGRTGCGVICGESRSKSSKTPMFQAISARWSRLFACRQLRLTQLKPNDCNTFMNRKKSKPNQNTPITIVNHGKCGVICGDNSRRTIWHH